MRLLLSCAILVVATTRAASQTASTQAMNAPSYHPVAEMQWMDGPATLPHGTKMIVLEGDPAAAGLFTMRIKFPAGMHVAPHFHTQTEHATVIAGTLHIGMGAKFDSAATQPLKAGSFGFWPAGMKHFAWMEGEVILQMHGQGPWTITYVKAADDPRNTRK